MSSPQKKNKTTKVLVTFSSQAAVVPGRVRETVGLERHHGDEESRIIYRLIIGW